MANQVKRLMDTRLMERKRTGRGAGPLLGPPRPSDAGTSCRYAFLRTTWEYGPVSCVDVR
jgi:hypothetical protein